jgi:putative transposase
MPRTARAAEGGLVYHVLNRGNGRMKIFRKPGDYQAFVQLLIDGLDRAAVAVFGYCLMPNHWHIVLRPKGDGDLSAYLSWVSNTRDRPLGGAEWAMSLAVRLGLEYTLNPRGRRPKTDAKETN